MKLSAAIILCLTVTLSIAAEAKSVKHARHTHKTVTQTPQVAPAEFVLIEIKRRYPATVITSVTPSGITGIYEVRMGSNIAYTDEKVQYFLFGHLFDMQNQRDITQDRIDSANKIDFKALPLDKAIKIVKGKGERIFAVFTDPDCPYCKQLERNINEMDNYTMYVFMYPIPQLHPAATDHSNGIWCAPNRAEAWSKSMVSGEFPTVIANCATPTDEVVNIGQSLGVQGTPTIFRADGRRQPGALSAEALSKWLDGK